MAPKNKGGDKKGKGNDGGDKGGKGLKPATSINVRHILVCISPPFLLLALLLV